MAIHNMRVFIRRCEVIERASIQVVLHVNEVNGILKTIYHSYMLECFQIFVGQQKWWIPVEIGDALVKIFDKRTTCTLLPKARTGFG